MTEKHAAHGTSSADMARTHYLMFGFNLLASTAVMYFVMFTMIWSTDEFFNNLNMFYMALMMATPMGVLMLLMMGSMYSNRALNAVICVVFAAIFALSFYAMRDQSAIGDEQFLRSMIPHHSGAILMCERAVIEDPQIGTLCADIVEGQREEIEQMKRILARK